MTIRLKRVNPFEMREPIVDFFWRIRMWPYPSKDQYFEMWDWRYSALSESEPAVWVAMDDDTIVGHISVHFRQLSVSGQPITVGVPANFRVDSAFRKAPVGGALGSAPRTLVQRQEIGLLMGYGNQIAHALFVGLGFRDLGPMQTLLYVRKWGPILGRRFRGLAPLAPLASAATQVQRLLSRATPAQPPSGLTARVLAAGEIQTLDRAHWHRGSALTWDGSLKYFTARFGRSDDGPRRVFGIFGELGTRLEGLVAVDGLSRYSIVQCDVNDNAVSAVQAVELVARATPNVESVRIALLPDSDLASQFTAAGYLRLPAQSSAPSVRDSAWSAYWLPSSPLAKAIEDTRRWNVWYGWSHH